MLNRILILFAAMSAVVMVCGKIPFAGAEWRAPIVIPQQPQFSQPQVQQSLSLSRDSLKPTLQPLPSAPQVTTGSSVAGGGQDDIIDGQVKTGSPQVSESSTETSSAPVSQRTVTEARPVSDIDETPELPKSEPSKPKTPWLLAAGVAVAAFLFGRRTRGAGSKKF